MNAKIVVKIENDYADGHHSETTVRLSCPPALDEAFWEDEVWPHTGDGHGADGIGSCYTMTVIECPTHPEWVGLSDELID